MNKNKLVVLALCAATLVGLSYIIAQSNSASPAPPTRPDPGAAITFWQNRVANNPTAFTEFSLLGEAYLRQARQVGGVDDYRRAEAAFRRALEINPNYVPASALLSNALFAMHDFEGALSLAQTLTGTAKVAASAWATIGDARLALGQYVEAEAAYQKLQTLNPGPGTQGRLAFLAELQGDSEGALALMEQAAQAARQSGDYAENLAWYEYQMGEFNFKAGTLKSAEAHYQAALDLLPNYYLALTGLGKVRAAQARYAEAIALYEQAVAILPQPDVLAALGDLYLLTDQPDLAEAQYQTVEFIGQLDALNQVVYNRQLALFYANHDRHLDEALTLAQAEWHARQDILGADALAWALHKHGRDSEAAEMMEQALRLGTHDATLYYHAGMIYASLGEAQRAQDFLNLALALNPYFDPWQARLARAALTQLAGQ